MRVRASGGGSEKTAHTHTATAAKRAGFGSYLAAATATAASSACQPPQRPTSPALPDLRLSTPVSAALPDAATDVVRHDNARSRPPAITAPPRCRRRAALRRARLQRREWRPPRVPARQQHGQAGGEVSNEHVRHRSSRHRSRPPPPVAPLSPADTTCVRPRVAALPRRRWPAVDGVSHPRMPPPRPVGRCCPSSRPGSPPPPPSPSRLAVSARIAKHCRVVLYRPIGSDRTSWDGEGPTPRAAVLSAVKKIGGQS
jgi:hypothetical protein